MDCNGDGLGLQSPAIWDQIIQIPPGSYGNAPTGCFHAEAGAGHTCMDALVVKFMASITASATCGGSASC